MPLLLSIVAIGFAFVVVLCARSFVRDLLALTRGGIIGSGDVQWMTIYVVAYIDIREQPARRSADPGRPRRSVSRDAAPTTPLLC
jgi:hypothetical protein